MTKSLRGTSRRRPRMESSGILMAPLMWRSSYCGFSLTSTKTTRCRLSTSALASSTETYFSGTSGSSAGAGAAHSIAVTRRSAARNRPLTLPSPPMGERDTGKERITLLESLSPSGGAGRVRGSSPSTTPLSLASREDGAAAHGRATIAELLGLHGLSLAAVRNGIEPEVAPDGVHLHEVVAAVGHDPPIAIQASKLPVANLVDLASRDPEVLPALGDGRRLVADEVVAVIDFLDDVRRVTVAHVEYRIGHADERDEGCLGRLPVAIGLPAEDRGGLATVHEALEDAPVDMSHAPSGRALVVVLVVPVAGERGIREGRDEGGSDQTTDLGVIEAFEQPGASRIGRFHLEPAVELHGMADDLVRDERVVVRVGDHGHLALEARQRWRGGELDGLARHGEGEGGEGREGHEGKIGRAHV